MVGWLQIAVYAVGGVIALSVLVTLFRTRRPVRRWLCSGVEGLCALAAVNIAGAFTGVSLGLGVFTGLCCLVLGIPGVVGLLLLKLIFHI